MTDKAKEIILETNEHIKATVEGFEKLNHHINIPKELKQNSMIAIAELMACIKHLAFMQGDITGKELMPLELFDEVLKNSKKDEQAH